VRSASTELPRNHTLGDLPPDPVLFGCSEVMQQLRRKLTRICPTDVSVLLQGEVGVGKSLFARFIHSHSTGIVGPFVSVNCAALSGTAVSNDRSATPEDDAGGIFARDQEDIASSSMGTLFLDQIDELPRHIQQRLLSPLADYEGSEGAQQESNDGKLRIISASTRDLRKEVKLGRFRAELFYRLAEVTINVPPLRNRTEDLPILSEYLRLRCCNQLGIAGAPFPSDLLDRMLVYPWPGNIRELENFVRRYVLLGVDRLTLEDEAAVTEDDTDCVWDDPLICKIKRNWPN
jgi:DNA-binding NtrC family response regulator